MLTPIAKTRVGISVPCEIEGRASGCSAERVAAKASTPNVPIEARRPMIRYGVSATRRPARTPSSTVSSAKPSGAMVSTNGVPAPTKPAAVATAGSSVIRISAPEPSSQMSTAARQNTNQSICSPY